MFSSPLPPEEIDVLVLAAQEGDKDAFGKIYESFFDSIYKFVYFRVDSSEVDDLVGSIFIKSWVHLEKYEKRDVSFAAWLFRIANNSIIDHRRAHRSIRSLDQMQELPSEEMGPVKETERSLLAKKIRAAVAQLREPYKQVVSLKFLSGLSTSEVAEIMGEREGNVRLIQCRALKELKSKLGETPLPL
jgi:RNA polymerase sigma-70 factor (ECF subfamily)